MNWKPMLSGELSRRALSCATDVMAALREPPKPPLPSDRSPEEADIARSALGTGDAGLAVLFAYAHSILKEPDYRTASIAFLNRALETIETTPMGPGLYSGLLGIAWAKNYVGTQLDIVADDELVDLDEWLLDCFRAGSVPRQFDVVSGLVGVGVYCLDRSHLSAPRQCSGLLMASLGERASVFSDAIAWLTPPEHLPPMQRRACPEGHYNLGMAHGIPGIIAWLARAHLYGIAGADSLLLKAVPWLLRQRQDASGPTSCFPAWTGPNTLHEPARIGWCYGDPGVAASLILAGQYLDCSDWTSAGVEVAADAMTRAKKHEQDPGLCHGVSGLLHTYNRLAQYTGDGRLSDAATTWAENLLELRDTSSLVHFSFGIMEGKDVRYVPSPGLVDGAAGVCLALLAACGSEEPTWDRILLLS